MLALNYRDSQPLYSQIRDGLRRLIVSGALEPGEKLPSVRAMAADLAINPNTIQPAYSELENEGLIHSVPGEGSYAGGGTFDAEDPRRETLLGQLRELLGELRYLDVSDEELMAVLREGGAR